MTSCYPTWTYLDLIQTYDLPDKRRILAKKPVYSPNTIMNFLDSEEYSIFRFIATTAQMTEKMDQELFNSTLFVCSDENLKKNYTEDFFMNLDRNTARTLLNYHTLTRQINLKSLLTRRACKIDTKNPKSQLNIACQNGTILINSQAYVLQDIARSNGNILIVDNLLAPENFC